MEATKKISNTCRRTQSVIVRSFVDLLQKHNFKDISVRDILKEANVSRTTFYRYYEDKYLLLEALLNYYLADVADLVKALTQGNVKLLFSAIAALTDNKKVFCALSNTDNEADLRKEILGVCKNVLVTGARHNENHLLVCATLVYTCVAYISSEEFSLSELTAQRGDRTLNVFLQSFSSLSA